jgi:type II restriction/modification system DNA methylase subunit YeeA
MSKKTKFSNLKVGDFVAIKREHRCPCGNTVGNDYIYGKLDSYDSRLRIIQLKVLDLNSGSFNYPIFCEKDSQIVSKTETTKFKNLLTEKIKEKIGETEAFLFLLRRNVIDF